MTTVSVVMPLRNVAAHVERALASVWAQTRPPDECIAVVGRSHDGTREVVARDRRVRVVDQVGDGLAAARNQGIGAASGALIAFLDGDDEWLPDKTRVQIDALTSPDPPAAVVGHMERVPAHGDPPRARAPGMTPSALMFRRSLVDRVGPFDERYRIACDTDWLLRVRDLGLGPLVLDAVVLRKHLRAEQLSRDVEAYRREMLAVVRETSARRDRRLPTR